MTVRQILATELARFSEGFDNSDRIHSAIERQIAAGETEAQNCFVCEDEGEWIGHVLFWSFPQAPQHLKLGLLQLPWDEDYDSVGRELLTASINTLTARGAREIEARFQSNRASHLAKKLNLIQGIGFKEVQKKQAFKLNNPVEASSAHLTFRSLTDVGEELFVRSIARVTQATLDRNDRKEASEQGSEAHSRYFFNELIDIADSRELWRLAYDLKGDVVGLVVPQLFTAEHGCINYIGVVPESRGRGFIDPILAEGCRILLAAGAQDIVAETDAENAPMLSALRRFGFEEEFELFVLVLEMGAGI